MRCRETPNSRPTDSNERPWLEPFVDVSSLNDAHPSHLLFPVGFFVLVRRSDTIVRLQYSTLRLLTLPDRERNLIVKDALELMALQWTMNRFATHLLPPASRLFIAHDEVLVVDAREMKVQHTPVDCRFPHQTGVTERSISRHDRRVANRVLHDVVIAHQPDWIRHRFIPDRY